MSAFSKHPVSHLRKVAMAYKKELGVSAVSKMTKADLIVLLDKFLVLDKDDKIRIKGKSTEGKDLEEILESKEKEEEEVKPKMKREVKESKAMEKKEGEVEKMVKIMKKKKMY